MTAFQWMGALELGLIYGIIAISVYLTFRVINFPDLTIDGSFPLGAAITAALITHGVNPIASTGAAFIGGTIAGFITGFLHVRWKILGLLAGILTMSALYSINLRIMKKPNISVMMDETFFHNSAMILPILLGITVILVILLTIFLRSQIGLALRGTGINPTVCSAYGIDIKRMTLIGLSLSNGLAAFAGSLFTQAYGFADVSMGTGTLIVGLASVIVGETLFSGHRAIAWILCQCILGSLIYRLVIAVALNAEWTGLLSSDLNLITSILVVLALQMPAIKKKIVSKYQSES